MEENRLDSRNTSKNNTTELIQRQVQQTTIVNRTKKFLSIFYGAFENNYKPSRKIRKQILKNSKQPYIDLEVAKYNNMVKKFYKRPELMINDSENLKEFNILSFDGTKLNGMVYEPNVGSKKWVVISHWFTGNKFWITYHAQIFAKLGYNLMAIDFRGHGNSEDKITTLGVNETHDFITAVRWLHQNRQVEEMGLFGTSMGAFVANFASLKYYKELDDLNLKFIVSDAGYVNISKLIWHFSRRLSWWIRKKRKAELFEKFIAKMDKSSTIIDDEIISYKDINLFRFLKNRANSESDFKLFPTLFFHSLDDKQTMNQETYEYVIKRTRYYKGHIDDRIKVFSSAPHTQCIKFHFKKYNEIIIEFLESLNLFDENQKQMAANIREEWQLKVFDENDKRDVKSKLLE
ncbi:alpha/beta fold hydrolase [Spiroplasma sp. TIUS-1]|uniref:alpha/beta hydrolase n=1 Tax=Spiroplasma sp. TIUS-1 TaxID=216963 RepID=UPI0013973E1B|nr:alpha/beta fold hydrolase [Spiroplasma sp. TIUS-1]QHX35642.1 alpha/beta fold hydrolase [Spiroplasma sp. TIUS-1]